MSRANPERWFYLDGFEASEFCPLWRWLDRFWVELAPPRNWCRVSFDEQGLATVHVPIGDFHEYALNRVNEAIDE
jgi:hypothetical protein